jgi:UDP-glucose 4-epimerase
VILADAHLRVLARLETHGSCRYNIGNGEGHSVKQVLGAIERCQRPRRAAQHRPAAPGRSAVPVAASERLRRETGWAPRFGDIDEIVRTTWAWREAHPKGYGSCSQSEALKPLIQRKN